MLSGTPPNSTTQELVAFLLLNHLSSVCFMQLVYLAAYCFETQLVTESLTWQRRRRLKNLFTCSSATHPEPISSPLLLEAVNYQPHLFKIKNYHNKMWGVLEAKAATAYFLSPDTTPHPTMAVTVLSLWVLKTWGKSATIKPTVNVQLQLFNTDLFF